jgi:NitT/TauT family transport system ATP-binding protein/nitrate/nitrite transport system substrate-binding protein
MLRLTDAAPVVMAHEMGLFAERGLDVRLFVEPSWANIADKLTFGHLDAAVMLPPLALAMALGLRGTPSPVIVPMGISLNGNSVTVNHRIADAVGADAPTNAMETGRQLGVWLKTQTRKQRFAVVHTFSTHNLLLRYWLAAAGVDPDKDVEITILPPAETAKALKAGEIDGFCAGAPWGSIAAADGAGRTILVSSEIWRDHPEKCLAVGRFAEQKPENLHRLVAAIAEAGRYCDEPRNAADVAAILTREDYLDVDAAYIRASLPSLNPGLHGDVDRSVFAAHATNTPLRAHASWFLSQMARWRYLPPAADVSALIEAVYHPEVFQAASGVAGTREPEHFCDGADFDPQTGFVVSPNGERK